MIPQIHHGLPKEENYFEKFYNNAETLTSCLWTTVKKVSAFILLGFLCLPVWKAMSCVFFAVVISTITCKLVTKSIDCYNPLYLDGLKDRFFNIQNNYPYIPIISWIFTILITPIIGFLGVASGAMIGLYNGMLIENSTSIFEVQDEVDPKVDPDLPLPDYMI